MLHEIERKNVENFFSKILHPKKMLTYENAENVVQV